jgi:hypothetical protein
MLSSSFFSRVSALLLYYDYRLSNFLRGSACLNLVYTSIHVQRVNGLDDCFKILC